MEIAKGEKMRSLASICTIENVIPMHKKDLITCVTFVENGYEAIVPKKDAIKGNKLAFIQEGSILPVKVEWEFLRKRCFSEKENGFIIRPMTMGKKDNNGEEGERVKSWGLAVSINELPLDQKTRLKLKAGDDITELLEIRKYEPAEDASPTNGGKSPYPFWVKFCLSHDALRWIGRIWQKTHKMTVSGGGFPTNLISKSDETTIQNMKSALERYAESEVVVTAKMEGQSFTVVPEFDKKKKLSGAYICSRNNAYHAEGNNIFWECMRRYDIVNKMKKIYKETGKAYILQGEQTGPGIQQNIYNFKQNEWFVFTIKDYETLKQLSIDEMMEVAAEFGLHTVPIIADGIKLKDIMPTVDAAVKYAENVGWKAQKSDWGDVDLNPAIKETDVLWEDYFQHEGVVVRSVDYDKDANVGVSFKVKNLSYQEKGLGNIAELCRKALSK